MMGSRKKGHGFGQRRPPLTELIQSILERYPDGGQILKELIQNADDAGATEVSFLYDNRCYGTNALENPELAKFQGPALYCHNNATFKEEDWEGIQNLMRSNKKDDPMKVGRFGIGFNSVYHITDLPGIVSGETVGFLDPHETYFTDDNGKRGVSGKRYYFDENLLGHVSKDQFSPFHGIFGCHLDTTNGYDGTLFRFPLRTTPSELSMKKYTKEMIDNLFHSLQEEASVILLFLKSVQSIKVYKRNDQDGQIECVLKVEVAEDTREDVRRKRNEFLNNAKEPTITESRYIMNIQVTFGSQTESFRWLTVNQIGSSEERIAELADELCLLPWVGIAVPIAVETNNASSGRIFCFLPLPPDVDCQTGLPVHVHGYFGLTDNRRGLVWPGAECQNTATAEWNELLLKKIAVQVYCKILEALIQDVPCTGIGQEQRSQLIYSRLPALPKVQGHWEVLLEPLFQKLILESKKLFYAQRVSGNSWITLNEGILDRLQESGIASETREVILKMLLNSSQVVVTNVPPHILEIVATYFSPPRDITPSLLRSVLKSHNVNATSHDDKVLLLDFILRDDPTGDLNGIPLLPLANKTFATFCPHSHAEAPFTSVFVPTSGCTAMLLPNLSHRFLDENLPEALRKKLIAMAANDVHSTSPTQLVPLTKEIVLQNLRSCLPSEWFNDHEKVQWIPGHPGHPPESWLKEIWNWIHLSFPDTLSPFKDLPLVQLPPLPTTTNKRLGVLSQHSRFIFDLDGSGNILPPQMIGLLMAAGCTILSDHPSYLHHPDINSYIAPPTAAGTMSVLSRASLQPAQEHVKLSTSNDRSSLREFFTRLPEYLATAHRYLLNQLPLFDTLLGSCTTVQVNDQILNAASPEFSLPSGFNFRKSDQIISSTDPKAHQLLKMLTVPILKPAEVFLCYLFPDIQAKSVYSLQETTTIMLWILQQMFNFKNQSKGFQDVMKALPFVSTDNANLKKPSELYDPNDALLSNLFLEETNKFPSKEYNDGHVISTLKELGLRTKSMLTAGELLGVAGSIASSPNSLSSDCKVQALVEILEGNPDYLDQFVDGEDSLKDKLLQLKWLPHAKAAPESCRFPKSMPWFNSDTHFFAPTELRSKSHAHLVGSTMPILGVKMNDNLQHELRLTSDPPVHKVVAQLKAAVQLWQQQDHKKATSQFQDMLDAVYKHLSQISQNDVANAINDESLKQWIWHGTGFCSPAQVALKKDFPLDLRPQLFLLPENLNDNDSLTNFFLQHGVRQIFSEEDIISVLVAVKDKHASFVLEPSTLREIENDLKLCRSILEWLVEGGKTLSESLQKKVLVPVQSIKNKLVLEPCKNCTYCDRDWLRHGGSELDIPGEYQLIHDSVPASIAKSLGVPALSTCLLSAETLGFEQTGPYEPLTTRLSNILKEYKEGVGVFKELIQNADDAGASKVRFLVDWRESRKESLLSPDMEHCQGPALWAYNDAVFTDKDFENINKLAGATKVEDLAKIGRFGLGFNAVYHLTDVPSFVSREYFVVFDPNVHHMQSHITDRSRPGIRINLAKNPRPLSAFEDQFQPYHAIFNCDTQGREGGKFHYDGTLFRFPFRTLHQASKSEICQKVYDEEKVKEIVGSLRESVSLLLLYTQHVNEVELYELSKNNKPQMMQLVLSVKKSVPQETSNEGSVHTSTFVKECSDWWRQKLASEDDVLASPSRSELITIDNREMMSNLLGNTEQSVKRETWLVSSCVGTESSARLALGEGREHGLLPCGGAATKLTNVPEDKTMDGPRLSPEAITGEAFCFLPLSIATGLPVHINGYFAITSNRRSIWERSTSDQRQPIEVQWNERLMEDALSNAYIQLLEDIKRLLAGKSYSFQKLLPCYGTLKSSTWGTLVKSVYSKLVKESLPLLWSNGKWLDIHSGYILDEDLRKAPGAVETLNYLEVNVFDLTEEICSTLAKSGEEDTLKSRTLTMEDFFKEFVFPNIAKFPVNLRDHIVWFGLDRIFKGQDELIPLFKESSFVPTDEGQLKKPSEIYDPNDVLLQHLFLGETNKFPTKYFASEHVLLTLKQLGLRNRTMITLIEILKVAETISSSPNSASSTQKVQALVNILQDNPVYLNQYMAGGEPLKDKLLQLKWLPRAKTPPEFCRFPEFMLWFNSDTHFFAPTDLRSKSHALLVGSTMPILGVKMNDNLQHELRLTSDPPVHKVVAQLKAAVQLWQQQDHKKATSQFQDMLVAIYQHLSQISQNDVADAINDASLNQWIWHGTGFCSPAQVALEKDFPLDLRPQLFLLPEDLNDFLTEFFFQHGVRQKFSEEDIISVLVAVKDKHASFVLESSTSGEIENDLKLCRSILEWLVEGGKTLTESLQKKVLVPVQSIKNKLVLEPCKNCTYCDRDWLRHGGSELDIPGEYQLIHDSVPTSIAKSLGVPALSTCLLSAETLGFEQTGPYEPLTTRLSNILKEYKEGVGVFKELIQNADDAGASKVRFLVDWREGRKESLLSPDMEHCQGPALWAYNDAVFTDKDFENINKLAGATKVEDLAKIGRFGLGFNAVYHLTDVPSFVSREYFVVFDPNVHHLQSHITDRSRPGIRINLAKNPRPLSAFEDQFQPYHAIFNCDTQGREGGKFHYDGTLFRFPFRTLHQASKSEICQKVYDEEKVKEIVGSLRESISLLLLYTQHVNEVELYELSKNNKPQMMQLVLSVKKSVPQETTNEGSVHTSPFIKDCSDWWRQKLKSAEAVLASPSRSELITIGINEMVSDLVRNTEQSVKRETWLVSSCVGTESSARLALGEGREHGLLPCGGAATKLSHFLEEETMDGPKLIPEAITGEAFCFLPLSIATGLPVHINGYFAITSNRRSIWERSTSEQQQPIEVKWNESLMEDALSIAYIRLLETMKHLHEEKSLQRYYFHALWPCYGTLESSTWRPLVKSVYSKLVKESLPLLWSNGKWLDIHSGYILDEDLRKAPGAVETLNYLEVNVFDLTEEICSTLAKSGEVDTLKSRTLTLEIFLEEFFFPNITKLPQELRDPIVCFCLDLILHGREEIASLIKGNSCIRCSVDGVHLAKPHELINPEGAAADLFSTDDNRFPIGDEFLTSNRLHVLDELGMVKDQLSWDEICERARSIEKLAVVSYKRGLVRARNLIKYLNKMIEKLPKDNGIETILRSTMFLPFMSKPPSWYCLPWKGSEYEKLLFYAPKDLFLEKSIDLVGSCFLIVDDSDDSGCGKMDQKVKRLLGFYGRRPRNDQVLLQLDTTINTWSKLSDESKKFKKSKVESVCKSIYSHFDYEFFDNAVKKEDGSEAAKQLKAQLDNKTWLFVQGTFISSDKVASEWRGKGAPFLYGLPEEYSNKYQNLIQAAEVKKYFDETDFVNAVNKLKDFKEGSPLTDDELSIVVCFLTELKNPNEEFFDTNADCLFLPDNNKVLSKADELSINNTPWLSDRGEGRYVHKDITNDLAFKLGAKSLLERRRKKYSKLLGTAFGQHEKLTDRLKNILKSYPCDSGILKELVQNADDAKATEIHFVYDTRILPHKRVFQNHADEIQGPALCVYNDRHFSDEDLKGIQRLGIGSKSDDPEKTGQYGVGFNAVYHLTDCPSFLSNGDTLCVLDPHCRYAPDATPEFPGEQFSPVDAEFKEDFSDALSGYLDQYFDLKGSTLFRLPLRDRMRSQHSLISQIDANTKIIELLKSFRYEAKKSLLFLNHVKKISISNIDENGKLKREYEVTSIMDEDDQRKRESMSSLTKTYKDTPTRDVPWEGITYPMILSDSNNINEEWLIHQCFGVKHKNADDDIPDGRSYGLLPRGGVAALVSSNRSPEIQYQTPHVAYCFLPLPVYTSLPVHVNGHFALDPARRALWEDTDVNKPLTKWNNLMKSHVLAPGYASLILEAQDYMPYCEREPEDKKMFFFPSEVTAESGLHWYHKLFPNSSELKDDWKTLAIEVYCFLESTRAPVLPVIVADEVDKNKNYEKKAPRRIRSWLPVQEGFFLDTLKTKEPLWKVLLQIRLPVLVSSPLTICNGFKEAKIIPNMVSPESIINALRNFCCENSKCEIGNLPSKIEETLIRSTENLKELIRYCQIEENAGLLIGLPLLLTADGILRVFEETKKVYCSQFSDLFPRRAELFVHPDLVNDLLNAMWKEDNCKDGKKEKGEEAKEEGKKEKEEETPQVLLHLTASLLASFMPDVFPLSMRGVPKHQPFPEGVFSEEWLRRLWLFLQHFAKPEQDKTLVSLDALKEWPIIPTQCQKLVTIENAKTVLDMRESGKESGGDKKVRECLKKLNCPSLDTNITFQELNERSPLNGSSFSYNFSRCQSFTTSLLSSKTTVHDNTDGKKAVTDPYVAHPHSTADILQVLNYMRNTDNLDVKKLSHEEISEILQFIQDGYENLESKKDFDKILKKLPLFKSINNSHYSLSSFSSYAIVPGGVPTEEIEKLQIHTGCLFLHSDALPTLASLLEGLGAGATRSVSKFYAEYILPNFSIFSNEGQLEYLTHIRDDVFPSLYREEVNEKEVFLSCLKCTACIPRTNGELRRASEFYDPRNDVFKIMLEQDSEQFPPCPFDGTEWLDFLINIGLHNVVNEKTFLQFCEKVASVGNQSQLDEINKERSKKLVRYLLTNHHLHESSFLSTLSAVKFIASEKVESHLLSLYKQYQCSDENQHPPFLQFSNSVPWQYRKLVWTSASLLPEWAEPEKEIFCEPSCKKSFSARLHIRGPSVETVISHLQNISGPLSETSKREEALPHPGVLRVIMTSIYAFLQGATGCSEKAISDNCDSECKTIGSRLETTPCILVEDNKVLVRGDQLSFKIHPEKSLRPFLYAVPRNYGGYEHILKRLGATEETTSLQLAKLFKTMQNRCKKEKMHPEYESKAQDATYLLFKSILKERDASEGHSKIAHLDELYLPSVDKRLIKSNELLCKVPPRLIATVARLHHSALLSLEKCGLLREQEDEYLQALPEHLRPKPFYEVVKERLDPSCLGSTCQLCRENENCEFIEKHIMIMESKEFQDGIVRLLKHQKNSNVLTEEEREKSSRFGSSKVEIKCMETIKVHLILAETNKPLERSSMNRFCYVVKKEDSWKLYIQHTNDGKSKHSVLSKVINKILDWLFKDECLLVVADMLSCDSPSQIADVLTSHDIQLDVAEEDLQLGREVPVVFYYLMQQNPLFVFHEEELVAFGVELRDDSEDDVVAAADENEDAVSVKYVLAKVIRCVTSSQGGNTYDFEARYLIDLGNEKKEVSVLDLYKFYQNDPDENPITDMVPFTGDTSRKPTNLNEAKREISEALRAAWRLPPDMRRKVIRRLYLRWHPDKNSNNVAFATDMMAFLLSEIKRMEEEEKQLSEEPVDLFDFDNMFRNCDDRARRERETFRNYQTSYGGSPGMFSATSNYINPNPGEASRWLEQSENDLEAAQFLLTATRPFNALACFLSQQIVEKSLKAALYAKCGLTDDQLHTHDVYILAQKVSNLARWSYSNLVELTVDVASYYLPTRYPNRQPRSIVPCNAFRKEESTKAVQSAKEVLRQVRAFIGT